jgi:glycosyltransferase involved in cell wall biosynthesis
MKIALLHFTAPPVVGGVESVMAHHARLMSESGHAVTIFAGRGETFGPSITVKLLPLLDSRNPEVLAVKSELDKGIRSQAFENLRHRIQNQLLEELPGFDVLIAHNLASLNQNLALTAALYSCYSSPGFPRLILWHHDQAWSTPRYQNELHPGYPWDLLRSNWPGVTHVTISETRRRELASLIQIPEEQIHVVPNGVELTSFFKLSDQTVQLVEQLHLLEADPLFLLPVRITPRKNIELALKILKELRVTFPNAMLVVTGPEGPHNPANTQYREMLIGARNELQLQGAAHFLAEVNPAFLPDEMIADLYRLADALLFPSREEGFGIPLIEAGFSGIPVFCTDLPVFRELGGTDLTYFDPEEDPAVIAAAIAGRMEAEMTVRWARHARHGYTWRSIYRRSIEPILTGEGKE